MRKITSTLLATAISSCLYPNLSLADHLSGGFDLGQSSAILTESANPLPQGRWYASISTEIVENQSFSDDKLVGLRAFDILQYGDAHADLHSIEKISGTSISLGYGFTENLTVGLRVPYVKRENIREPDEGHSHDGGPIVIHDVIEHGDSSGLGDTTLMGMYRFRSTESSNMALLFGVKLPTGEEKESGFRDEVFVRRIDTGVIPDDHGDDEHDAVGHSHTGNRLETHQQPGSGSYDSIAGFAYSRLLGQFNLDSSLLYTFANEGSQDTNLGDSFKYNLALTYPLQASLDMVLELNGEWRDREVRGSEIINNSGGRHLYLSPGFRYQSGNNWSASLSLGLPLKEDINGYQSEPEKRWSGSLSFNF
mgnify:CR=1 FL=1|jgi:hypothetical protein